jgi:hypothetical protein
MCHKTLKFCGIYWNAAIRGGLKTSFLEDKMKTKGHLGLLVVCVLFFGVSGNAFADGYCSLEQFKKFKNDHDMPKISASSIYANYKENGIQFESNFKNSAFIITGRVARVRKGFFDEYIVELDVPDSFSDISVVYPASISQAKIKDLAALSKGDYFEALVSGRSTYMYVDVLYYKLNGATRTEL